MSHHMIDNFPMKKIKFVAALFALSVIPTQAQIIGSKIPVFVQSIGGVQGPTLDVEITAQGDIYQVIGIKFTSHHATNACVNAMGIGNVQIVRDKVQGSKFETDKMVCFENVQNKPIELKYTTQLMHVVPEGMKPPFESVKKGKFFFVLNLDDSIHFYEIKSSTFDSSEKKQK